MRNVLLLLCCASYLLGFAEMGNAFPFLGGGGGGKRAPVDMWASGKFDNKLFQNQGRTIQNQNSNPTDENIRQYLDGWNNGYRENGHGGGGLIIGDGNSGGGIGGYTGSIPTNGITPVPEPAAMLLLGVGLILLAGYGRKKLNKQHLLIQDKGAGPWTYWSWPLWFNLQTQRTIK